MLWQKVTNLEGGGVRTATRDLPNEPDVNGKLSEDQASKVEAVTDEDFIRGSIDAEVILIEYSDFECPFCAKFHTTAKQAIEEYEGKVAWVYRHFPLDTIHPRAIPSANASECVADIGGRDTFWSYVDYLFENQSSTVLGDKGLTDAAGIVGVDIGAFSSCFSTKKFSANVDTDYESGLNAGVTGTPGNFIMNKKGKVWVIPGAVPFETLRQTIDEALAS